MHHTPLQACKTEAQRVVYNAMLSRERTPFFALALCLICVTGPRGQAAFINLDFESASLEPIPDDPYSRVYFSPALPGWNGLSGTNQLSAALYDNIFLDSTGIAIFDTNTNQFYNGSGVIKGNYSVFLEAGVQLGSSSIPADASLSQTGLVPVGTKSLSFLATAFGPFSVSLGGTTLNLISSPVANHNYSLYEADISAFAGQTAELKFAVFAQNPYQSQIHGLTLDDIQFSPNPVPEPSTLLLTASGALLLWPLLKRKRV
jgi:hypothetical protein